jgi:hypothetical protein
LTAPAIIPDWFDTFWEKNKSRLPIYLRNDATKELARTLIGAAVMSAAQVSQTPQGVKALIAFSRITAIVKGVNGVCDSPDPSPEEVAAAVERLVQRVKP